MYYKQFKQLHFQSSALLLGNVWDVNSALIFQKLGFKAIGTSSAAIATSLGYEDGENMPFEDLLRITKNIQEKINIPLTVDLEAGYSKDNDVICKNIHLLADLNVAGINIEDSIIDKQRQILGAQEFGCKIKDIKKYLTENHINIFINVRIDNYIIGLDNPLDETMKKIQVYEKAGADGIFVPCIVNEKDIEKVIGVSNLPINVMTMPSLADFNILSKLGVKRISMGPFAYNKMLKDFEQTMSTVLVKKSFDCLFVRK